MSRSSRKMDHVRYALSIPPESRNGLDDIRFVHNALPETSLEQISLSTTIGELVMSSPILINAMTGGAEETKNINGGLAEAARETGTAMAVGSQMAALKAPENTDSYTIVRRMNPRGIVIANLGSEATADQAKRAVDMIEANALQIHLNVVQELVMPEGDRSFTGVVDRIEHITAALDVPVIVKEVGFGMTAQTADKLFQAGAAAVDCGGFGGTNFGKIENARRDRQAVMFNDWGNSTAASLLEVLETTQDAGRIVASGGIRSALDAAKSLALGAGAVGMAGAMLRTLHAGGVEALVEEIRSLQMDIKLIMTAAGAADLAALRRTPLIISGETAHWCSARGVDIRKYARRQGTGHVE